jgi:hypothetical protein
MDRPYLKLRATDKERGELESIDANIHTLPAHLDGKDAALIAVLDALKKYYEANPTLSRLEIEIVADNA